MMATLLLATLAAAAGQTAPAARAAPAAGATTDRIAAATREELAPEVIAARRERLVAALGADAVAVLAAPAEVDRNYDNPYPYRTGSDFWYMTGFAEPGALALLQTRDGKAHLTLFVPPRNPGAETWTGRRLGVEGAKALAEEVAPNDERGGALLDRLKERLSGRKRVLAQFSGNARRGDLIRQAVDPGVPIDEGELRSAIGTLRRIKGPEEIALLQRAIDNTCEAQRQAMRFCRPGMREYELQAVIEYCFTALGSPRVGFDSIVGSGRNSVILHYMSNREEIPPNSTVVCDLGAEYGYYSADVTRTLPTDGKFTPEAAAIYQAVLDAQSAGIALAKPGSTLDAIDGAARRRLAERLVELGVVQNAGQAQRLLPHGCCHWLGLDTHDECPYGRGLALAPGMVTTVEPGCYVPAGTEGVDPKYFDLGVRIEDDVLITADGNVVLSASAPRAIAEIEALMDQGSDFPRLSAPGAR